MEIKFILCEIWLWQHGGDFPDDEGEPEGAEEGGDAAPQPRRRRRHHSISTSVILSLFSLNFWFIYIFQRSLMTQKIRICWQFD